MKIVCLIRSKPPLIYFVNRINRDFPVSLAIVEEPVRPAKPSFVSWLKIFAYKIWRRKEIRNSELIYEKQFGNLWRELNFEIPILKVKSINDAAVKERLLEEKPDILLDHGTSIVKNEIISIAPLTLNVHWGLSPYYRGTYCTNWALLNRDPYNIGVTVHSLTKDIDGGGILGQTRVVPEVGDTVRSINMKITREGTEIVLKALARLLLGKRLNFHSQDLSIGFPTYSKDYTMEKAAEVSKIEKQGLKKMLARPSKLKEPIFEDNV